MGVEDKVESAFVAPCDEKKGRHPVVIVYDSGKTDVLCTELATDGKCRCGSLSCYLKQTK